MVPTPDILKQLGIVYSDIRMGLNGGTTARRSDDP